MSYRDQFSYDNSANILMLATCIRSRRDGQYLHTIYIYIVEKSAEELPEIGIVSDQYQYLVSD
jgi:hypothetical protein